MKKIFTLIVLFVFSAAVSFAQGSKQVLRPITLGNTTQQLIGNGLSKEGSPRRSNRPARAELVTPPDGSASEVYYTVGGTFYNYTSSGWTDYTTNMSSVNVVVNGDKMYIQGLAYWFTDGWIEGTIDGSTVTFANGQLVGTDDYGDEFLVGSNDGSTVCDIVFAYDSAAGTLTATTTYICESAAADAMQLYCYWQNAAFSTTEPETPEVVVVPGGVEQVDYALSYTNYSSEAASGAAKVAVDGNDVYFQGFSSYIPDAWIKGTKDGNTVTFPSGQYLGSYAGYDSYLEVEGTFTYDPTDESYSLEGNFYTLLGSRYIDVYATNPVLKKVVEKAVMPANPSITGIKDSDYGDILTFNVPLEDVDGNALLATKLSFMFYIDIEKEISPLTFEAGDDFTRLEEDITEIPYGFSENYDFYTDQIYLNMAHDDWNRIGIKSIYRGGDEVNETEIQWYTIKEYTTIDEDQIQGTWVANEQGYENAQDIDAFTIDENISATCSQNDGTVHPKYYNTGNALRIYGKNSLTISGGDDVQQIDRIVLNYASTTDNIIEFDVTEEAASAAPEFFAAPALAFSISGTVGTWTGAAKSVTFTNPNTSGHARIVSIDVTYTKKDLTGITTIGSDDVVSVKYFDLQGRAASENTRGVLLKQTRDANGNQKTVKVINK